MEFKNSTQYLSKGSCVFYFQPFQLNTVLKLYFFLRRLPCDTKYAYVKGICIANELKTIKMHLDTSVSKLHYRCTLHLRSTYIYSNKPSNIVTFIKKYAVPCFDF